MKGHGLAVDWWCLGCIIYEMVTGFPPFKNNNKMILFDNIKLGNFQLPDVSHKLQNLLARLLERNPKERLGAKGPQEVKEHPFFEKINWEALKNKSIKAPFVPIISSDSDISNFDAEFTSCNVYSYSEQISSSMDIEINQDHFADFEFGEE